MKKFLLYLGLFKIPMSLMICFSAVFGYIMYKSAFEGPLFLAAAGIFLLACGGACLNNYQDRHFDLQFSRTRNRALPSKSVSPTRALVISSVLIILGTAGLYFIRYDLTLPFLGTTAILLYNGIYTPLKSRTVLAIIPGALCGMMPPLIGWTAAGGDIFSLKILSIMILFGLWQLPHFWLILLNHSSEYSQSAIPNMLKRFNRFQLEKMVFIWIVNFSVMLLFVPILYWGNQNATAWILAATSIVLISVVFFNTFQRRHTNNFKPSFQFLNSTVFFIMLVAIIGRFV